MPSDRFSDPDPVEEILRIAVQKHANDDASLRQRLLASASELGISEEAALAAQKEWEQRREAQEEVREFRAHLKKEFASHFWTYVVVNAFLAALNLLLINREGRGDLWFTYPAGIWGLIVAIHAMVSLSQWRNPGGEEFESFRRGRRGDDPLGAMTEEEVASTFEQSLPRRKRDPRD